jgi:hypothetical protein
MRNLQAAKADGLIKEFKALAIEISIAQKDCMSIRQQTAESRWQTADSRQQTADGRQQTADGRRQTADTTLAMWSWIVRKDSISRRRRLETSRNRERHVTPRRKPVIPTERTSLS